MRYARKILYVDAVQFNGKNIKEIADFMGIEDEDSLKSTQEYLHIITPNGCVNAFIGDWVCRDSSGNYYPCIDEVFRATYYVEGEIPLDVVMKMVPDDVKEMWKEEKK